jgi:hypothetical protein
VSSSSAVKPTIVLVHGAFADSSSWDQEIQFLQNQGYPVMAKRADAHIVTTNSGHDVPAARPGVVDSVILQAVQSVS